MFSLRGGEHLVHGGVGQQHAQILLAREGCGGTLHDADDLELVAVEIEPFAERIEIAEPRFAQIFADHRHRQVMPVIHFAQEAPVQHHGAACRVALLGAADIDVVNVVGLVLGPMDLAPIREQVGTGVFHRRAAFVDGARIIGGERLAHRLFA